MNIISKIRNPPTSFLNPPTLMNFDDGSNNQKRIYNRKLCDVEYFIVLSSSSINELSRTLEVI